MPQKYSQEKFEQLMELYYSAASGKLFSRGGIEKISTLCKETEEEFNSIARSAIRDPIYNAAIHAYYQRDREKLSKLLPKIFYLSPVKKPKKNLSRNFGKKTILPCLGT